MEKKLKVGVLGATGMVGQRFVSLLADHPWYEVAAVAARRLGGDWAVSMRSRDGLAGRVLALLKDGKKVRGGGHGDASALYFPRNYTQEQMRDSILAAIKVEKERSAAPKVTLGDLFKGLA